MKILSSILVVSYLWGAVLGSFVHNLVHHIGDVDHHHSIPCLTAGLTEKPADESALLPQVPTIEIKDCELKLALHNLSQPTIGAGNGIQIELLLPADTSIFSDTSTNWHKEFVASSASSRGPPVFEKTLI